MSTRVYLRTSMKIQDYCARTLIRAFSSLHTFETAFELPEIATQEIKSATGCSQIIVAVTIGSDSLFCERVNAEAYKERLPCIFMESGLLSLRVGPTVSPHRGACWRCYHRRLESHLTAEELAVRRSLDGDPPDFALTGRGAAAFATGIGMIANQIAKLGGAGVSGGMLWEFDHTTGLSSWFRVVQFHGCGICGQLHEFRPKLQQEIRALAMRPMRAADSEA
jgi:bacteriocin biosynthesis cyclodehydratase domain-containing protein